MIVSKPSKIRDHPVTQSLDSWGMYIKLIQRRAIDSSGYAYRLKHARGSRTSFVRRDHSSNSSRYYLIEETSHNAYGKDSPYYMQLDGHYTG